MVFFNNGFRLRGERFKKAFGVAEVLSLLAGLFFLNRFSPARRAFYRTYFACTSGVLKAFGVAEVLSLLAKKVPKETSPGIARQRLR